MCCCINPKSDRGAVALIQRVIDVLSINPKSDRGAVALIQRVIEVLLH